MTTPISTIAKRFFGSNPIGIAYTGVEALEYQVGLASEYPVPERLDGSGIESLRKRLFNDMGTTNPPTKRIRHHDGDKKEASGGAFNDYKQINAEQIGKLYVQRIRLPPLVSGIAQRNARKHDIFLKGVKIDFQAFGLHAYSAANPSPATPSPQENGFMGPCVLNWALIQLDCSREPSTNNNFDEPLAVDLATEWWSSFENSDNESRPFVQFPPAAAVPTDFWSDYLLSGRINPHHPVGFKILARESTHLQQIMQNGAGGPGQKTWGRIQKYFKIPQFVYLHDNAEKEWNHPLYMVHWISPLSPSYLSNFPAVGTARHFDTVVRTTTFFNNIDD